MDNDIKRRDIMREYSFSGKDFKGFEVEGLEERMEGVNEYVRGEVDELGCYFEEYLSRERGESF
ncbi:DUF1054 family protein, partial [Staphylococcus epidermidis]|uniref:DUF1054 family protein n=1 Tax=Staphylococcus epidermidis TaxID=1282 RepID=UPI0011A396BD